MHRCSVCVVVEQKDELGSCLSGCFMQFASNTKVKLSSLYLVCNQGNYSVVKTSMQLVFAVFHLLSSADLKK